MEASLLKKRRFDQFVDHLLCNTKTSSNDRDKATNSKLSFQRDRWVIETDFVWRTLEEDFPETCHIRSIDYSSEVNSAISPSKSLAAEQQNGSDQFNNVISKHLIGCNEIIL